MTDISNRKDIILLSEKFYQKLLSNPNINFIFTDVAKINLESHLPKIINFWCLSMFGEPGYDTNVMHVHLELNEKFPLQPEHFKIWLDTFFETVDENFSGINADSIKTRALSVATIMQLKTNQFHKNNS